MKKNSISIPKPCHENWDAMLLEEKGRFCNSCSKTVIDFTKSSDEEIANYFQNNIGIKTCGRFKKEQLKSVKIEIPEHIIYQQTSFRKAFLLALFVTMGTTLFSCKDQNNFNQTLGEIVVVEDSISNVKDTLLVPLKNNKSTTKEEKGNCETNIQKPFPNRTMGMIVVEPKKEELMGDVIEVQEEIHIPKIYHLMEVDVKPKFSNGEYDFQKYITNNLILPNNVENSNAIVQFIINTEGKMIDINILRGKNAALNQNIIELLQTSPKWSPAEVKGEKVNVNMAYPIRIKAQ